MIVGILLATLLLFWQESSEWGGTQTAGLIFVFLLLGSGLFLELRKKQKRTRSLRTFARKNNWSFKAKSKAKYLQKFLSFKYFDSNSGKKRFIDYISIGQSGGKIRNVLQKPFDQGLAFVFDYKRITGDSDYAEDPYTVIAFYSPHLDLPEFSISPGANPLSSVTNFFRGHFQEKFAATRDFQSETPGLANVVRKVMDLTENSEIKLDSNPRFAEKHWLMGKDKSRVQQIFTPEVLGYFERKLNFIVEGNGNCLFFYNREELIEDRELNARLQTALEVFNLFRRSR